ncbi:MAG TPA: Gfo/Idh/MocA family oxidoreductase [Pirellulales bacterium]|nr:Gfo/Idh/MocA family oxidoreductase [Pirellulales bacterium]
MARSSSRSRREFLRQVGGGAAAGLFSLSAHEPRVAMAGAQAQPANEQIRLGAIGVGGRGTENFTPLIKQIVAVCDVDKQHLSAAQARIEKTSGRACDGYGDYRRLLDRQDIDAVIVSTPDHWHALPTIDACRAGKDVYVEKPLALTIDEGRAMVAAARRYDRIVQTGSQQRSDQRFRTACELVRSGAVGKLHTVRVGIPSVNFKGPAVADSAPPPQLDYDFWLGPAPQRPYNEKRVHYLFRFFWDYSGGQLTNFGAHHLDIAQWGLAADETGPTGIEARARYDEAGWYEVPTWCEVIYTYANGVKVVCGQGEKGGVTFEGDRGTIHVDRGKLSSAPAEIVERPLVEDRVHLYESGNHYQNWLDCIRSRKPPICDVAIGHRSATVCHLGNIAIRTGRKIAWDPEQQTILGDTEAASMLARPYRAPWELPSEATA